MQAGSDSNILHANGLFVNKLGQLFRPLFGPPFCCVTNFWPRVCVSASVRRFIEARMNPSVRGALFGARFSTPPLCGSKQSWTYFDPVCKNFVIDLGCTAYNRFLLEVQIGLSLKIDRARSHQ